MISQFLLDYCGRDVFLYQLTAALSTYYLICMAFFYRARWRRYQLFRFYGIPGPKANLYDGNLGSYHIPAQHEVAMKSVEKYGPVHSVFVGDEANLIIKDLDTLKKIYFERTDIFKARSHFYFRCELSESILYNTNHERWKTYRRLMAPHFGRYIARGGSHTDFIENSVKLMLDYIEQRLERHPETGSMRANVDMHDLMKATALHLITSLAVKLPGVQVKENEETVRRLDSFMANADKGIIIWVIRFPFLERVAQFVADHFSINKLIQKINREIEKSIAQSKATSAKTSAENMQIIDILIKLHHEGKMTRDEVVGNAQALLYAGYDTTSTSLTYIFWCLAKYTEVQERLRDELLTYGIESKYLMQVINETLRCFPVAIAFATRLADKTVTINGLTIPQGSRIMYHQWVYNMDPKLWPEPEKFDPERFAEGKEHHPCAFAPFGMGERRCIGMQLALLEMKMVVCDVLLRYKVHLKSPQQLQIVSYAAFLTKPSEKVALELERIAH